MIQPELSTIMQTSPSNLKRLRTFLCFAQRRSPYYRELFATCHFDPRALERVDDLSALPILSRKDVRERGGEMVTRKLAADHKRHRHTSGSTASPLVMPVTLWEQRKEVLLWLQGYTRHGLRPWHRQAKFAFSYHIPKSRYGPQHLGLFRRQYMDLATTAEEKIDWLRAQKPDAVFAWSSVLDEISATLERKHERMHIPLLFTASEMLFPQRRARIAERMGGRIVDAYGTVEAGPMAWECPAGEGYHIHDRNVVVEIVDDQGRPAEQGRLVCTILWRRTLPLIRYDTGDLATWAKGPCPCGATTRRIASLEGREIDLVRLPSGEVLNAGTIIGLARDLPGLTQYQVIQSAPDQFTFLLAGDPHREPDMERIIRERIRMRLGSDIRARIKWVDAIHQPTGVKFVPLINEARLDVMREKGVDMSTILEHIGDGA